MKRFIPLFALLILGLTQAGHAQSLKFAHIDTQELLASMPESDSAQKEMEKLAQDFELQIEEMQVEFNKKYDDYLNKRDTWTELIRQTKETEIMEMQNRIQQFENTAQQELQRQRQNLLRPILEKANNAIDEVAEENGYIYVFDSSMGNPIYISDKSVDIMDQVKTKLGL